MAAEEDGNLSVPSRLHMVSAFLAMEPSDVVISFARECGGGSVTESVQSCIWHSCISKADLKWQGQYLRRFLKKLIFEIESSGGVVLDELYEQYASYMVSLQDDDADKGNSRILKRISFLFPDDFYRKLEVQLQCSVNMLEGDTGCSIWPSSLFLSEFILSYPEVFANKCCFEVGSGVGLVGVCLSYVKASKVILTDGDLSTLANMKVNLELNNLRTSDNGNLVHQKTVHCLYLPWETASEDDLRSFAPDIILGADVIYDPSCLPHLVRVLAVLLKRENSSVAQGKEETSNGSGRVAYIASVIRNVETFNCFLEVAKEANLTVTDLTEKVRVFNFLPYLKSCQRFSVRLFKIHV